MELNCPSVLLLKTGYTKCNAENGRAESKITEEIAGLLSNVYLEKGRWWGTVPNLVFPLNKDKDPRRNHKKLKYAVGQALEVFVTS